MTEAKLTSLGASGLRTGVEVERLGVKTGATILPFNTLGQSMRQFDGVLSSVGVNLSPQIRAIEDLSAASGRTASQLGGFTTAGLAAGAAMAGWQTGRAISEFFGLDDAIGKATASLLDWNAASVTEAAKLDVITKAIANGAQSYITYADAIVFNQKAHDAWKGPIEAAEKLKAFVGSLNATSDAVYNLTQSQKDVIRAALAVGTSHTEIAAAIGISTAALELYIKGLDRASKASTQAAPAATQAATAITTVTVATDGVAVSGERMGGVLVTAFEAAEQQAQALGETLDSMLAKLDASQQSFVKLGHKTINADGSVGSDLGKAYVRSLSEFDPAVVAMYRKMGLEDWQILNILLNVATIYDYQATIDAKKPGGKGGGTSASGGGAPAVGSLGSPGALSAGLGGVTVQNTFTFNGVIDPAGKAVLARVVSEEITRSVLQGKKLGAR